MNVSIEFISVIQSALNSMGDQPRDLARAIRNAADTREVDFPQPPLIWLIEYLSKATPNDDVAHMLGLALRKWDRTERQSWCADTAPLSDARRHHIYELLKVPPSLAEFCNHKLPRFVASNMPAVIAEAHEVWYGDAQQQNRYYWGCYSGYLKAVRRWDSDAIANLDHATDAVLAAISDPCREKIHQSKGLVVGYVQSGKTSHFTGVLAKAVDAGYRFIIVLAGTLDILRSQTQRRIDKELIGKELLGSEYVNDEDWKDFISHGVRPSDAGHFDWERLTGADDFQSVGQAIAALAFNRKDPAKRFNDPINLRSAPVRLFVIKKNSAVIARLARDLGKDPIRPHLSQIPALIVDDESDQASINTVDPRKKPTELSAEEKKAAKVRTSINKAITGLMKTLPRAQYIGYTATPFANVLINPDDAEDLFPRDFIISLPRPDGYMGVKDFYDLGKIPEGFYSNQKALVVDVCGNDDDKDNLPKAIDSFVLAGAIKLFREKAAPELYRYRHHTMLVHHSAYRKVQANQAERITALWENRAYQSDAGVERLKQLFEDNFSPVSSARAPELPAPKSFTELVPYIKDCLEKLNLGKTVLIVNGDNPEDTPNFEKNEIWAILVGGAKLSRGYTVEGLTTTYFRRVATTSDTLMQMGRWFGFRPGYHDLVRLFIGRKEPIGKPKKASKTKSGRKSSKKKAEQKTFDLYEAFRALCLDEEEFRADIEKYLNEGLRPLQVPPLVPSHLRALAPTAKNKMYNANIVFQNFGGSRKEPTMAPTDKRVAGFNAELALKLLQKANLHKERFEFRADGDPEPTRVDALCGVVTPPQMCAFLDKYTWETGKKLLEREVAYLGGKEGDPEIERWLIVAPEMARPDAYWPEAESGNIPRLPVRERSRVGHRFGSLSEPNHVKVANYLANIGEGGLSPLSQNFSKLKLTRTAVMLFYIVQDSSEDFESVLFALQFPNNSIPGKLAWQVRIKAKPGEPVPAVIDRVK
ncbi:Endonuclease [Bradyrhizobium sp.]|uniref:Z1 domain-containing protein n=1 Tax=Bradyrhizobium sp. TaxID=376 RepID=UPI0007C18F0E|nr:Z1 domain-containing protein [Bradyrhizobium sp.]CUT09702.1 Endonuclease [Bradyrhizobium sp.]